MNGASGTWFLNAPFMAFGGMCPGEVVLACLSYEFGVEFNSGYVTEYSARVDDLVMSAQVDVLGRESAAG